jgi:hypothetical protein
VRKNPQRLTVVVYIGIVNFRARAEFLLEFFIIEGTERAKRRRRKSGDGTKDLTWV